MPRRTLLPKEVFLSHSSRDKVFARKLINTLHDHGVPTWYSGTNILGAQQWHDEIGAALQRCDWFAVILSPNSVKSEWVKRELLHALNDRRLSGRVILLLYRKCRSEKLSWTLAQSETIDFRGRYDEASRELLKVWGIGLRR
ncbi:MAG: toll/interleukin-1 receptor domain-containing protein [Planctomycetaceae bacterium]|nr:toll/interleukin-1 receptor domain-containing protein [Planctomycetaceae bacterium]